jgi:hypothetical protein
MIQYNLEDFMIHKSNNNKIRNSKKYMDVNDMIAPSYYKIFTNWDNYIQPLEVSDKSHWPLFHNP